MPNLLKKDKTVLVLLLVLLSLYSAGFIYKTSFVIDGKRYFSLFDDAMISMRYARNLAEGYGLVMNPGERVEGYTNPLWVLYMAAVHLFPLPESKISLVIQVTGLLLLLVNLVFVRRMALLASDGSSLTASAAMFLTAFYLPLINWTLQGMEVGLQTLILSVVLCKAMTALRDGRFSPWIYILLGVNTLVRIDMAVPFAGVWLFLARFQPEHRRRHLLWGGISLILFLGSQTAFRLLYYGDWLPNTYYLKMTGYPVLLRLTRGFYVWWRFVWNLNPLLLLVPAAALVLSYNRPRALLALVVGLQMLYSIYVGGDAWEDMGGSNRYISVAMPGFFVLFAYGLSRIRELVPSAGKRTPAFHIKVRALFLKHHFALLTLLAFFQFNDNDTPLDMKGMLLIERPFSVELNKGMVERALLIRRITTPEAKIAVTWSGAIPYFSRRMTVDLLGKTDRVIARTEMRRASGLKQLTAFLPGHMKFDYSYSIGKLEPDAVLQFWGDIEEAEPYMLGKYTKLVVEDKFYYLRNGSDRILWEKFMKGTPTGAGNTASPPG